MRACATSAKVFLRGSVIVIVHECGTAIIGIDFIRTIVFADLRRIIVGVRHGDDGISLDKHGELPQGGIVAVDDASAFIHIAVEIVHPFAFGQVDVMAHVVTLLVGLGVLIDGCHEEIGAKHKLVLSGRS